MCVMVMASAFHQKVIGCGSFVHWIQLIVISYNKRGEGHLLSVYWRPDNSHNFIELQAS